MTQNSTFETWRSLAWSCCDDFRTLRDAWLDLAAGAPGQPFQHPAWIGAWLGTRGKALGIAPRIAVGRRQGQIEIIIPLGLVGRGGRSVLRWLGSGVSDYNAPLATAAGRALFVGSDCRTFWSFISVLCGPASVIDLANQRERIGDVPNPFVELHALDEACCAHSTAIADAAAGGLSKRHRKRLRQVERDIGGVGLVTLRPGAECHAAMHQLIDWKTAQLDANGAFSPFRDKATVDFLLATASDPAMPLRIAMLRSHSTVFASFVVLESDRCDVVYQCTFNPAFAHVSPGTMLRRLLEADAQVRGIATLDFGPGDESYKVALCQRAMRLKRTVRAVRATGLPMAFLIRARLAIKRGVKSRSLLFGAITAANRIAIRAGMVTRWKRSASRDSNVGQNQATRQQPIHVRGR